ncbi:MAG: sugar phosphate isomerase/epimerase [Methylobacteriaceae bacterium]|nr:sugar phosphate isomerase/epimerase [Methylobacteriaceae bacterium]
MKPIDRLSFQLYSARGLQPLEKQFELLASLGYKMVELFGGLYADPAKLRSLLDTHGMTAPTAHVGFDRLRADVKAAIALCKSLGVKTMLAPAPLMGERDGDEAHWRKLGKELAGYHKIVTGEGLSFGWHNHHWEYGKTASGKTFLDCLFEEAPGLLWEADLAWIVRGGADPVAELGKRKDQLIAVHIKDLAAAGQNADEDGWADPGHGVMDWTRLLAAIKATTAEVYAVEHDKPNDVARFARRARDTVAAWA